MGEGNRYIVSGIAALLLFTVCQSCGKSQEYVDFPDSLEEDSGDSAFFDSVYPTIKRAARQPIGRSRIVEQQTVLRVACVGGSFPWFGGQIQSGFQSDRSRSEIQVLDLGSDLALEKLQRGDLDLVVTTRALLYRQKKQGLRQRVVGHETWLPVVHRENPLTTLSRTDLVRILDGELHDWSQLVPWSADIQTVILDPEERHQRESWRSLFPDRNLCPHGEREQDWAEVLSRVSRIPGGIAIVPMGAARSPAIKVLRVDGKNPGGETLHNGSYTLGFDVYITYRVDSQARTLKLMDYLIANRSRLIASARPGR